MREMVSVAMATYNGSQFIFDQVQSILAQLNEDDELVISDDGSTDETVAIVEKFQDARIRILKQTGGLGPTANFEKALAATKGDLIFLADQDDLWLSGRIQSAREDLKFYGLSFCDCQLIDVKGKILFESFFKLRSVKSGFYQNLWRNGFHGCCLAFRREVLNVALPFPKSLPMHDWWIGLIAEKMHTVFLNTNLVVQYRRHEKNSTSEINQSRRSFYLKLRDRFFMWREVALRFKKVKAH